MKKIETIQNFMNWRVSVQGKVGFVPTMGALHEGHMALIRKARGENDFVAASIFVNPTQFNDPKDLEKYPRTLEKDLAMLEKEGVAAVFLPHYQELYQDDYEIQVKESNLSSRFCGAHRPGHFDGVLTVVMKLLQIVQPHNAYFGEKDYQQYLLIKKMVESLFVPINIIPVPTVREADGLAMSSRNLLLSEEQRKKAPRLNYWIKQNMGLNEIKQHLTEEGFKVDYLEEFQGRRLVAAFLGSIRLIDNVRNPNAAQ